MISSLRKGKERQKAIFLGDQAGTLQFLLAGQVVGQEDNLSSSATVIVGIAF